MNEAFPIVAIYLIVAVVTNASKADKESPKDTFFRHRLEVGMTSVEWKMFGNLINVLDEACEELELRRDHIFSDKIMTILNHSYVIFGGSLVGLYHNRGPLPWDDDIDVVMEEDDSIVFVSAAKSGFLGSDLGVHVESTDVIKIWTRSEGSVVLPNEPYSWPYIDVIVAREMQEGGYQVLNRTQSSHLFKTKKKVNFGGVETWAPNNIESVIVNQYGSQVVYSCHTNTFDHRLGRTNSEAATVMDCQELADIGYLRNRRLFFKDTCPLGSK